MPFGINSFNVQSATSDEVPGAVIPNVGTPVRRCHPSCESCPKKASHKGWIAFDVEGITSYEKECFFRDCHNAVCESEMQLQAANNLQGIHGDKVSKFEPDANGDKPYRETTFEVDSIGSGNVVCNYTSSNNPKNQDGFTLNDWGWLDVYGSKISQFGGINAKVKSITEPDQNGNGKITFSSFTSGIGGLLNQRANSGIPITVVFRRYQPIAIFSELRKLYTMACAYQTQTIAKNTLIQGINTIFDDGKHIAARDRKVEKIILGVATEINAPLKNIPVSGTNHVILDLTNIDLNETGLTDIGVSYWLEGNPVANVQSDTWTQESQANQVYDIASNRKADLTNVTYECEVWDSGSVWVEWQNAPAISNVWNGTFYNIQWDLTNTVFEYNVPESDPPETKTIDGVRVTYNYYETPDGDYHLFGDRCIHSYPDYSVGMFDNDCKRYCVFWSDLTEQQKADYRPKCFNENCLFFSQDDLKRENTYSATTLGGIQASFPYTKTYMAGQSNGVLQRRGAHSQWSNTFTSIDAPSGPQHEKVENMLGCGGWGKLNTTYYTYDQDEIHWEYPEEGEPYEVTETVTHTVSQVEVLGDIRNVWSKEPETAGYASLHRDKADWRGHWTRKRKYRNHCVIYPLITTDAIQEYQDGTIELGFWKADFTKQESEDGDTVYRSLLRIKQGIKPIKDLERRNLSVIRNVRLAERNISGSIALRNAYTTYSKPAGTGENEYAISARVGSNVLPADRPTNYLCPESLIGAGDDGTYILADMGLRIPDNGLVPERFRGLVFKITGATANDTDKALIDPDWNSESYKCENVVGLPDTFYTHYKYCDSIQVTDEQGQLAALNALVDLTTLDLDIVEQTWCNNDTWSFVKGKPDVTDSSITATALPSSGLFFFTEDLSGWCLTGYVNQADFASYLSVNGDLQSLINTQNNMLATNFSCESVTGMPGDNRMWYLTIEYERWWYNNEHTQILGDGTSNDFAIVGYYAIEGGGTTGSIGVVDHEYDESPLWRFDAVYHNPTAPFRSGVLDRIFIGSNGVANALANVSIYAESNDILRTITNNGGSVDIIDVNQTPYSPDIKLTLFGLNYTATGITYSMLGAVDAVGTGADGRSRVFNVKEFAKNYLNNKCSYQAFIMIPVNGTWDLPPGAIAEEEFLYAMFQQGIERNLNRDEDGVPVGTIRLKNFTWQVNGGVGGVLVCSSSGYVLGPDDRVSYRKPPANIKQQ